MDGDHEGVCILEVATFFEIERLLPLLDCLSFFLLMLPYQFHCPVFPVLLLFLRLLSSLHQYQYQYHHPPPPWPQNHTYHRDNHLLQLVLSSLILSLRHLLLQHLHLILAIVVQESVILLKHPLVEHALHGVIEAGVSRQRRSSEDRRDDLAAPGDGALGRDLLRGVLGGALQLLAGLAGFLLLVGGIERGGVGAFESGELGLYGGDAVGGGGGDF